MTVFDDMATKPFGAFAPTAMARFVLGVRDFDRPHRLWFWRRKLCKKWLRKSGLIFDLSFRGFKLRLHPASNVGDEGIVLNGIHGEEDEFDRVAARAAEFENFVDIGANIGLYSLIAAQAMPEGRRIIAFEPAPDTLARLNANLTFNNVSRVEVVQAALSEEPGEMELFRPPNNLGGTSATKRFDHWAPIKVPTLRLDQALKARGIDRIGMLKIDIEGYEDRALLPYMDVMPRDAWPRYILIEVCHGRFWKRDVVAELKAKGYTEVFQNTRNIHFALQEGQP